MKGLLKYLIPLGVFCLTSGELPAQKKSEIKIDSLLNVLKTQPYNTKAGILADTLTVGVLNSLAAEYVISGDYAQAMNYADQVRTLLEKPGIQVEKISGAGRKQNLSATYNTIGNVHKLRGNFPDALRNYLHALKLREEIGNKKGIAISLMNIGVIYKNLKDYEKAEEYYLRSLKLSEELEDKSSIGKSLNNLAFLYKQKGDYNKALEFCERSLKLREEIGDRQGYATMQANMGSIYMTMGNYERALELNFRSLKIMEESGDKSGIASGHFNLGTIYLKQISDKKNNPGNIPALAEKSRTYLNKAVDLARELGDKSILRDCYAELSELDAFTGKWESSLNNYKVFTRYRDSILNEENTRQAVRAEMNYDFEKKEQAAKMEQEKKDFFIKEENEKQKLILNFFIIAFALMVLLAVFIFRGYQQKQRANKEISAQKQEVEKQKGLVEKKQSQIIDSINYARRIQSSILIPEEEIRMHLSEVFVFYLPKDIVSGDFYWFNSVINSELILVAADCTGHGVPGAFLSMVGSTLLNEIVSHNNVTDPARIMKNLSAGVSSTLVNKEKNEENTDGMDISICKINKQEGKVFFAGANHSVYVVNSEVRGVSPQIDSINGIFGINKEEEFSSIELNLEKDSMVYMSTDGYADQVGGPNTKKLMSSGFEKLLKKIHHLPLTEQKNILLENFNNWRGNNRQVDDVLVIGFRI